MKKQAKAWGVIGAAAVVGIASYGALHSHPQSNESRSTSVNSTENTVTSTSQNVNVTASSGTGLPSGTTATPKRDLQTMKNQLRQEAQLQTQLYQAYLRGKSLFFKHDYQQAIQVENQVIQQDHSYYKAYNLKGIALCFSGHYQTGMQNINQALKLAPNYDYAHFNKGLALELYAHYDEALQVYHETIQIARPNWKMWSYYGIAAIYGRRGDVKDTVTYLKKAIAMDPPRVKADARTESDFDNVRQSAAFQNLVK